MTRKTPIVNKVILVKASCL